MKNNDDFSHALKNSAHNNPAPVLLDAPDNPPVAQVVLIVILSFLFVFICIAIAYPLLSFFLNQEESKVNVGMQNEHRLGYMKEQNKILSSYAEKEGEIIKIPIAKAKDIFVKNYQKEKEVDHSL